MASVVLSYECSSCKELSSATIEVTDPQTLVSEQDRAALRRRYQARADLVARTSVIPPPYPAEDPVDDLERNLLERFGRDELRYATCPLCGAKNPEGLVAHRNERRAWRWGLAAFFAALALVAWFWPGVALVVPTLSATTTVLGVIVRSRARLSLGGFRLVLNVALIAASFALVFLLPRFAFLIPVVAVVEVLRAPQTEEPFARAAEKIRFHANAYR